MMIFQSQAPELACCSLQRRVSDIYRTVYDAIVGEIHTPTLRHHARHIACCRLQEIMCLREIDDYLVVCDESNNDHCTIDRNELRMDVWVRTRKSLEPPYCYAMTFGSDLVVGVPDTPVSKETDYLSVIREVADRRGSRSMNKEE